MISMYVHMNGGSKYANFATDLTTACPRILLSGPSGISTFCWVHSSKQVYLCIYKVWDSYISYHLKYF